MRVDLTGSCADARTLHEGDMLTLAPGRPVFPLPSVESQNSAEPLFSTCTT